MCFASQQGTDDPLGRVFFKWFCFVAALIDQLVFFPPLKW